MSMKRLQIVWDCVFAVKWIVQCRLNAQKNKTDFLNSHFIKDVSILQTSESLLAIPSSNCNKPLPPSNIKYSSECRILTMYLESQKGIQRTSNLFILLPDFRYHKTQNSRRFVENSSLKLGINVSCICGILINDGNPD